MKFHNTTEITNNLTKGLSQSDYDWCKWAFQPTGGAVVAGKTWGKLNKQLQDKYERLSCNTVYTTGGNNPTCEDTWGDPVLYNWIQSV